MQDLPVQPAFQIPKLKAYYFHHFMDGRNVLLSTNGNVFRYERNYPDIPDLKYI